MMRLDVLTLQVPDIPKSKSWYMEILGMNDQGNDSIGYTKEGLKLRFVKCDTERKPTGRDSYWKIGIVVKNLNHAFDFLASKGVSASQPSQFLDIGYLCHLRDPAGLGVELLQQGFEGNHESISDAEGQHAIGGQATLAHITIRVSDLAKAKDWCEEKMKMRLMSIQEVELYGFTLYFYTWSDDELPSEALEAVENREWLWSRPYAMLELQHLGGSSFLRKTPPGAAGPTKILCKGGDEEPEIEVDCSDELGL